MQTQKIPIWFRRKNENFWKIRFFNFQNRNLGNLGNVCSTSNSETKCDSIFKTNKKRTEIKTKSFPYDLREKKIFPLFLRFWFHPTPNYFFKIN